MIREINAGDIGAVVEIEKDLFGNSAWNENQFVYEINDNPFSTIYVLVYDEQIAGYIDLWITYDTAQIANLAVNRKYWRKGFAKELMQKAIETAVHEKCENITLEVRVSNERAISLYEKYGFMKINIRKQYYEDGENAYLLMKPIGGLLYDDTDGD